MWQLIDTKTEFKFMIPFNYYKLKRGSEVKWVTEVEFLALKLSLQIENVD